MRVHLVALCALVALAGCARPSYSGPMQANVSESVSVNGSPGAIRAIEAELRKAIEDRHDDGDVGINLNEYSGPPSRTVEANAAILNASFEDARRKARALAAAVHATLGAPLAVDEVNAADAAPRYGGGSVALKGANTAAVTVSRDMPEIVRVTFALTSRERGPSSVTVYGLQAPAMQPMLPPTQLYVNINASGENPLKTVGTWEALIRDVAHRNGVRDADIRVGNVNANFPHRSQ